MLRTVGGKMNLRTISGSSRDRLMKIAIWSVIIACIVFLVGILFISIISAQPVNLTEGDVPVNTELDDKPDNNMSIIILTISLSLVLVASVIYFIINHYMERERERRRQLEEEEDRQYNYDNDHMNYLNEGVYY